MKKIHRKPHKKIVPGHPLHEAFSEMVEGDSDLHDLILREAIAVAQQHHLVMVREVVIGDGYRSRAVNRVDQPIPAIRQRAVVHPNMAPAKNRHPVPIGNSPPPVVLRRVPDVSIPSLLAVVYVEAVDDDVGDVLDGEAGPTGDVDARAAAVDCLERVEH